MKKIKGPRAVRPSPTRPVTQSCCAALTPRPSVPARHEAWSEPHFHMPCQHDTISTSKSYPYPVVEGSIRTIFNMIGDFLGVFITSTSCNGDPSDVCKLCKFWRTQQESVLKINIYILGFLLGRDGTNGGERCTIAVKEEINFIVHENHMVGISGRPKKNPRGGVPGSSNGRNPVMEILV